MVNHSLSYIISVMIYIVLAILGLAFGSFVNAFVWRWHEKKDWVKGKSECVHCHHKLVASDLIPVLSWLALKGKCRYCKKPISAQYPLVELVTAFLFVISYALWPQGLSGGEVMVFAIWLVLLVGLISLAVYDLKWMLLPDKIVLALFILAIIQALTIVLLSSDPTKELLGRLLGFIVGGGIFYAFFQFSKGRWIGGGDVKLGFLLGLIAGSAGRSFLLIFVASLAGTLISLPLLMSKKIGKTTRIPFGPFLIVAIIIVQLFGHDIITWYQNLFLPYSA